MASSSGIPGLFGVVGDGDVAVAVRPGRRDIVAITNDDFFKERQED